MEDTYLLPVFPANAEQIDEAYAAQAAQREVMDTATPERIAEVLEKAADILETDGWIQDDYYELKLNVPVADPAEEVVTGWCAVGSLRRATGFYDQKGHSPKENVFGKPWQESWLAATVLTEQLGRRFCDLPQYNDEAGRKAEEVIDLMKHTAKDLRNGTVKIPGPSKEAA